MWLLVETAPDGVASDAAAEQVRHLGSGQVGCGAVRGGDVVGPAAYVSVHREVAPGVHRKSIDGGDDTPATRAVNRVRAVLIVLMLQTVGWGGRRAARICYVRSDLLNKKIGF